MTIRHSRLSRAIAFFREADVDEARIAFELVKEVMEWREVKRSLDERLAPIRKKRTRRHKRNEISTGTVGSIEER